MVKPKPWKACWVWIELATFSLIRIIMTVVLIITNILPFDAKPVLTFPSFVSFYRSTGFIDCCSTTFWELVWVSLFIAWISGWATNVAFAMPGCASRFCELINFENYFLFDGSNILSILSNILVSLYYLDIDRSLRFHLSCLPCYYWWLGIVCLDHRFDNWGYSPRNHISIPKYFQSYSFYVLVIS